MHEGAIACLAPLINSKDPKLKRQVLSALGQIAKHSVELAELVVEGDVFPAVLDRLKDTGTFQFEIIEPVSLCFP